MSPYASGAALIDDLGGPDKVSVQQLAIVDITVRTYLFLEHIDHWLINAEIIDLPALRPATQKTSLHCLVGGFSRPVDSR